MRISDWSSDVCSSDLGQNHGREEEPLSHTFATSEPLDLAYQVEGKRPRLRVHNRPETISNFLRDYGVWQRALLTFMIGYLREGDTFVDVGANIGYFSIYAGLRVGSSDQVHAIEPVEANAPVLAANVRSAEQPSELQSLIRISYAV